MAQNPYPITFANLAGGNQPSADFDSNFAIPCRGDSVTVVGNVPVWGDTAGKYPTAGLPTTPAFGTIAKIVGVDGLGKLPVADGSNLTNLPSAPWSGVRQTVAAGPTTSAGLPSFMPASAGGLSISTQNISGTAPFVASSANGWSATSGLPQDLVGINTTSLTWGSLTNTTTNYLYVTISGGTLTAASTTLQPVYQWGGTPSTTSGQITFNIGAMQCFLGNGAAAPQTYLVVVGEATTSGGAVTSAVGYAYNGLYDSGFISTLPGAGAKTSSQHNIGTYPRQRSIVLQNLTTEAGYSVGDQIMNDVILSSNGSDNRPLVLIATYKAMSFTTGSTTAFLVNNATSGATATLTAADWEYKFIASRGW